MVACRLDFICWVCFSSMLYRGHVHGRAQWQAHIEVRYQCCMIPSKIHCRFSILIALVNVPLLMSHIPAPKKESAYARASFMS